MTFLDAEQHADAIVSFQDLVHSEIDSHCRLICAEGTEVRLTDFALVLLQLDSPLKHGLFASLWPVQVEKYQQCRGWGPYACLAGARRRLQC